VDVVVTDSSGHLVKGLHQSDFQVLEDGKSQALRYFKEISGAERPVELPKPAMKEVLAPNMFSNSALPAPTKAQ
jgi:hypothetical protein